jgi:hypothetical protein
MCAEIMKKSNASTEKKCDWIKGVDCKKRLLELCTVYEDRCNSFGKESIRERGKISETTHPSSVGLHPPPPMRQIAKRNLKNGKNEVYVFKWRNYFLYIPHRFRYHNSVS